MTEEIIESHAIATGIITAQLRMQGWDTILIDKFVALMAHHQRLMIDATNKHHQEVTNEHQGISGQA